MLFIVCIYNYLIALKSGKINFTMYSQGVREEVSYRLERLGGVPCPFASTAVPNPQYPNHYPYTLHHIS